MAKLLLIPAKLISFTWNWTNWTMFRW